MTQTCAPSRRALPDKDRQIIELLAGFLSARIGQAHTIEAIRRELQPRLMTVLNRAYISNAASTLRRNFGWAILANKHGIRLACAPAPLLWPGDLDGRVRWLASLPPRDRELVERLEAAAVEFDGTRIIRAGKAARIIGCPPGIQTGWINSGRITPLRGRVTPSQATPNGRVTGWPLAQAVNCGLSYRRLSRHWTDEDDDALLGLLGTVPIDEVAQRLERTACAVRQRGYELGVCETNAQGLMTVGVTGELCGVSPVTVRSWCSRMSPRLKHSRLPTSRREYMVSLDALTPFFRAHPDKFNRLSKASQRRIERATRSAGQRRKAVAA